MLPTQGLFHTEGEKSFAFQGLLQPMRSRPAVLQGAHRGVCQLSRKPRGTDQTPASGHWSLPTPGLTPPCLHVLQVPLPWTLHARAGLFTLSCPWAGRGCGSSLHAERQKIGTGGCYAPCPAAVMAISAKGSLWSSFRAPVWSSGLF